MAVPATRPVCGGLTDCWTLFCAPHITQMDFEQYAEEEDDNVADNNKPEAVDTSGSAPVAVAA